MLTVRRRLAALSALSDPAIDQLVRQLAARTGVQRRIALFEDARSRTPWTWGLLRPVIVLPAGFAQWPAAGQTNAILHEIAHIKRFDFLASLLGRICLSLYWFQPLVWLAQRALIREAENACDDRVIGLGASRLGYAGQLLELACRVKGAGEAAAPISPMASRGPLKTRVARILDPSSRRNLMTRSSRLLVVIFGLALALPSTMLRSQPPVPADRPFPVVITGPLFPPRAILEGLTEGTVDLAFTVDASGAVQDVVVLESSAQIFEDEALEAARKWKYIPKREQGGPVAAAGITQSVAFRLDPERHLNPEAAQSYELFFGDSAVYAADTRWHRGAPRNAPSCSLCMRVCSKATIRRHARTSGYCRKRSIWRF
jgi:TonB family protein